MLANLVSALETVHAYYQTHVFVMLGRTAQHVEITYAMVYPVMLRLCAQGMVHVLLQILVYVLTATLEPCASSPSALVWIAVIPAFATDRAYVHYQMFVFVIVPTQVLSVLTLYVMAEINQIQRF